MHDDGEGLGGGGNQETNVGFDDTMSNFVLSVLLCQP